MAVAALALLAVLIGGLTQISRQSHGFDASAYRSLVAQGTVVTDQSNVTAVEVRDLMAHMPTQARSTLEADLDAAVQETANQSGLAARAAAGPTGTAGAAFATVFGERARAVTDLRAAVDGLLGMHPFPIAGAADQGAARPATPALLTSTQATAGITAAGALLTLSDRTYRALRHDLAHGPGHARLPSSVWVTDAQTWQSGAVADQVDQVASSTTLDVVHFLQLRTVRLTPPALPTTTAPPAGTSVLSPSPTVELSVVLANVGTVDEPRASVRFSLAPLGPGVTHTVTRRTSVAAGGSVTLDPVVFDVKAGSDYQLRIVIALPTGQTDSTGTTYTQVLEIAPGT